MRAWAVYHDGFEVVHIVAAQSRGKAIGYVLNSAQDVGYLVKWVDFQVRRAAKFDHLATTQHCAPYNLGHHGRMYDLGGQLLRI